LRNNDRSERNAAHVHGGAHFSGLKSEPPIVEALLIPFHVGHEPIGTVWIVAHDEARKFDQEDERIIKTLAHFASAAWQLRRAQANAEAAAESERQQARNLAAANAALQAHLESRTKVEEQLQHLNRELRVQLAESAAQLTRANADLARGNDAGKQLRQSENMAKIGALALGIVHDFNNVLQVIQAHTALITSHAAEPNRVLQDASVIRETVEEGVALARRLLEIGRKTDTKLDLSDINGLLQRTTQSFAPMLPPTIDIAVDFDPRVPMIMIDVGSMYQAVLNLCINARDAMPEGGKILVQTRITPGATLRPRFAEATADQYACISLADTGAGMDPEVRSRVFDSHFTTKMAGAGNGLGLSIVRGIVSEHAGFIEVTSEPGCGATFQIYLPVPREEAMAQEISAPAAQNQIQDRTRQGRTVLYAEDDEKLLGLMQRLLEREGFQVLTARDGIEAVQVYGRHRAEIRAVILDSHLPKLNGWEAIQRMREIDPGLKAIIASGYISEETESRVATGDLSGVLQKPYFADELMAMIHRVVKSQ
jgi:signal transduction histidine kinase/CheY-like chemotaxis protein